MQSRLTVVLLVARHCALAGGIEDLLCGSLELALPLMLIEVDPCVVMKLLNLLRVVTLSYQIRSVSIVHLLVGIWILVHFDHRVSIIRAVLLAHMLVLILLVIRVVHLRKPLR